MQKVTVSSPALLTPFLNETFPQLGEGTGQGLLDVANAISDLHHLLGAFVIVKSHTSVVVAEDGSCTGVVVEPADESSTSPTDVDSAVGNRAQSVYVVSVADRTITHYASQTAAGEAVGATRSRVSESIIRQSPIRGGRYRVFGNEQDAQAWLDKIPETTTRVGRRVLKTPVVIRWYRTWDSKRATQVFHSIDEYVEWLGGAVNDKHLKSIRSGISRGRRSPGKMLTVSGQYISVNSK